MSAPYGSAAPAPSAAFRAFAQNLPAEGLERKTVVITGTTSGIGFVAASVYASRGARVITLNRPSQRAADATSRLGKLGNVHAIDCDLADFASVRRACTEMHKTCKDGIDVLALNAGVMALKDIATVDGYDVQMQTNHLSHFLLTKELFVLLERAAELRGEARVVSHSSLARKSTMRLLPEYLQKKGGELGGDKWYTGARWTRYGQTKLANCVFTSELADRLKANGSKVKALVAAPGVAATNLGSTTAEDGGLPISPSWFMPYIAQSSEDGAMPLLTCMAAHDVHNGEFYVPSGLGELWGAPRGIQMERSGTDEASRAMLWKASTDAVCDGEDFLPRPH